jgi:hypothetical protein
MSKFLSFGNLKKVTLVAFATLSVTLMLSGCGASSVTPEPTADQSQEETSEASALTEILGRAVSASDTELILRTESGEMTFAIREEDVRAIDPEHIQSHAGIESIGFKVFYRNIDGVDYVVSVEEIDGSTLGFD